MEMGFPLELKFVTNLIFWPYY